MDIQERVTDQKLVPLTNVCFYPVSKVHVSSSHTKCEKHYKSFSRSKNNLNSTLCEVYIQIAKIGQIEDAFSPNPDPISDRNM